MTPSKARLTVEWSVPVGETGRITAALYALTVETRSERGCLECGVSTRLGAQTTIHFTEDWATEADLRGHVQSDRFTRLAELIENATTMPLVEFQLPGGVRGLDYAAEVREESER